MLPITPKDDWSNTETDFVPDCDSVAFNYTFNFNFHKLFDVINFEIQY